MRFDSLLNIGRHYQGPRRNFPFILAGLYWAGWLVDIVRGSGAYDSGGEPIGGDFLMGYTSGVALSEGAADELFNVAAQSERQLAILGEVEGASFSFNLPILQWIYVPFAQLPYVWSVFVWLAFGLGLLAASLKILGRLDLLPLALTFYPVYANFQFGQNAFVSLFILTSVWALWSRDKRFLAGLALACLLYKPQLVTGIGLLWLLNAKRDWPALAGFGVGAAAIAGLSFGLMPQAMDDYFELARDGLGDLAGIEGFPVLLMFNMRGFFENLYSPLANPLWLLFALGGIAVFVAAWRRRPMQADAGLGDRAFWFGAAILLTLWTTPHALIYDWTLLLIPTILLWQARPDWRNQLSSLYVLGWISFPLSLLLIKIQQVSDSPTLVQVSVLFFAFALYVITRLFLDRPAPPATTPTPDSGLQPQPASAAQGTA